jgi:ABC-type uncharacterized transport system substrate-binding protein
MRRREFISLLGGTAATWPLAVRAQQPEQMRRIGFVTGLDDVEARTRFASFRQGLEGRGWIDGRNLELVTRFGAADPDRNRRYVVELAGLQPAAIVTSNTATVLMLMKEAPSIPVVVVGMTDPVALGFAANLAHPDRNITGFAHFEPAAATKWLDLLREAAPMVRRLAILTEPESAEVYVRALQAATSSLGLQLMELSVSSSGDVELERAMAAFGSEPNGGLIAAPGAVIATKRALILQAAARHRLPAIYPFRYYVVDGGLMSYGPDLLDLYRRSANYVDRILKGAKVSDLPIQHPTKFELVVNLKAAKVLGLTIPEVFLLRADELIE